LYIDINAKCDIQIGAAYTQSNLKVYKQTRNTNIKSNNGVQLLIFCKKLINRTFSMRTGLNYIQKNYSQVKTNII